MRLHGVVATFVAAIALVFAASAAQAQQTLETIRERGKLLCGVHEGLPGFSSLNDQGERVGFDVDFCKATAAAIGVENESVPVTAADRFPALQAGEVDLLYRTTTWTFTRDVDLGFTFHGVNFYTGQGFMVKKSLGVDSVNELDGASICVATGTTTELNLSTYFRANNLDYEPVVFEAAPDVRAAYLEGRCDAYTTDRSGLAAQRSGMSNPDAHVILPEIISKEPLGPVTREGDEQWGDIVRWVFNALIIAEEQGVTKANVANMLASDNPTIQRLLGVTGDFGEKMGLEDNWAVQAISAVGNYSEIYDRHLGPNTPLGLERGVNALWTEGGILYAPPMR